MNYHREVVAYLASKRANVIMICRNADKAAKARESILADTKCGNIYTVIADCGLQCDLRKAWAEVESILGNLSQNNIIDQPRLDGIVCNAGAMYPEKIITDEGVEATFALHLLNGTYFLVRLAMPLLESTPESRVIVVSSAGAYSTKFPAWEVATASGPGEFDGQMAYAYCKRGQILLCEQWTVEHPSVKFVSAHPGWVLTEAVEKGSVQNKFVSFQE